MSLVLALQGVYIYVYMYICICIYIYCTPIKFDCFFLKELPIKMGRGGSLKRNGSQILEYFSASGTDKGNIPVLDINRYNHPETGSSLSCWHTEVHVYMCIYILMYENVFVCMNVCIYVHICVYTCIYACMYVYIYVYMYVCMCVVYMYICMYVCICVYRYMYICMDVETFFATRRLREPDDGKFRHQTQTPDTNTDTGYKHTNTHKL